MTAETTEATLISSTQLMAEAGIITSQLEAFLRCGYIRPVSQPRSGIGYARQWSPEVIPAARLLGRLIRARLPMRAAGAVLRSGENRAQIAPGIWVEVRDA